MSLTFQHPVDGSDVVIENPLLPEHIQTGRLLWYWGFTSLSEWNCPAVITKVNSAEKKFRVRSLDDMREQREIYDFVCDQNSSTSRKTMRLASKAEVRRYLLKRRTGLERNLSNAKNALSSAKKAVSKFDRVRDALLA